jgi:predicted acetyltransferase
VSDLIGLTAPATAALLANLGTWARVAPTIVLRLPEPDPASLIASFVAATVELRRPWMLGVLDPAAAVAARGWPRHLSGSVDLRLAGGDHRLTLDGGAGRREPGGSGAVELSPRGLAVLYAGAAGPALLRRAGLLDGGDEETDAFLDAAGAGPAPALLDYF